MTIAGRPCRAPLVLLVLWLSVAISGCGNDDTTEVVATPDAGIVDADAATDASIPDADAAVDAGDPLCALLDVSATPASGSAPLQVQFSADLATPNTVYQWSWDLGDGTLSSIESPARSYYTPGTYDVTLTVTDRDRSCSLTKSALITVAGYSSPPVHVDPTNTADPAEDGSSAHPYDSWQDVTFAAGGIYLQKRGTIANEGIRITTGGTEDAHLTLGAYGDGAKPILDGTGLGDQRGLYIGQWLAGDVIGYVDVSDFEIRQFQGYCVFTATNHGHAPHHCTFTNLHLHHTQHLSNGEHRIPGMYLYHTANDYDDPLYNKVTHCHSEFNAEHGFKISSGHSLVDNCTSNDNGAHGVSCPYESRNVTVVGGTHRNNASSGVELGGEGSSATNVVCHHNRVGIEINELGNKLAQTSVCHDNDAYGVLASCHLQGVLSGITIDRLEIHDNLGPGVRLRNGCANVLIENTTIHDNEDFGVFLDQNSDYSGPLSDSIELRYSLLYNNPVGFRVTNASDVRIFNNTFYTNDTDDVVVASSGSDVLIRNSILRSISGTATEDHNTFYPDEDPLFVDPAGYDFHLQSGSPGSPCIDAGVDLGLSEDHEGNPVPFGSAPDIGAFECVD